jgi:hypothetical protein
MIQPISVMIATSILYSVEPLSGNATLDLPGASMGMRVHLQSFSSRQLSSQKMSAELKTIPGGPAVSRPDVLPVDRMQLSNLAIFSGSVKK